MNPRRTNLLLVLLVVTPLALLTWLGTYLIRDAARSTDAAMQAVLTERLVVADHHLVASLRHFSDQLDKRVINAFGSADAAAAALAGHPWATEVWLADRQAQVKILARRGSPSPGEGGDAETRTRMLLSLLGPPLLSAPDQDAPFSLVLGQDTTAGPDKSRRAVWTTFLRADNYEKPGLADKEPAPAFASGWHVTDGDFIYWLKYSRKDLICVRFDSHRLRHELYAQLPPPGLRGYPGRLSLATQSGIPLHVWGSHLPGSDTRPVATRACSAPLTQWTLGYSPAAVEFPKPYLFPILLGVSSGCLLVLALAWTFFRENARELRLAQQRVSFVNQISHELKTPLTNIQLYTEMVTQRIEDYGDTVAERHLKVVETETARLNRLIQNVLNYARQQRDKLNIQPRNIQLDEVVQRAVGNWRALLESKGFQVQLSLAGPPVMKADADALEQILSNLLSNVDKYALPGKWVKISTETAGSSVRLTVEDRGPGIPAGKRRMVFEPFERLRSDLNEGVSGTGIGLTISRELAELHGGSLEVCSVYKDGAKFILTLPVQPL